MATTILRDIRDKLAALFHPNTTVIHPTREMAIAEMGITDEDAAMLRRHTALLHFAAESRVLYGEVMDHLPEIKANGESLLQKTDAILTLVPKILEQLSIALDAQKKAESAKSESEIDAVAYAQLKSDYATLQGQYKERDEQLTALQAERQVVTPQDQNEIAQLRRQLEEANQKLTQAMDLKDKFQSLFAAPK